MRWTYDELKFLAENRKMKNSDIAKALGRTETAVKMKKYTTKPINEMAGAIPEPLSDYEKESRIIKMAADMRIKLKGWKEYEQNNINGQLNR